MSRAIVDFSNIEVTNPTILINEPSNEPNRKPPESVGSPGDSKVPKQPPTGLKLVNNGLTTTEGLTALAESALYDPEKLYFLDLSMNDLTGLSDEFKDFKQLRTLYIHSNNIASVKEFAVLKDLPNLRQLACHGNPLETETNYRYWLMLNIPQLRTINFTAVTPRERRDAEDALHRKAVTLKPYQPVVISKF
ncbi:hypothetical protein KIPB_011691 [Kipferlia bialata]|uniref:Leucine-rich repeat-containing protein 51 n=1 Tax=Kipferlia bialata TaxID=797122 RepID=A0A9K3GMG3_9EUKA|nr:hypothetical protein KIPB_011691 [Kipferlia bialata]|eukprot:g11691.t1